MPRQRSQRQALDAAARCIKHNSQASHAPKAMEPQDRLHRPDQAIYASAVPRILAAGYLFSTSTIPLAEDVEVVIPSPRSQVGGPVPFHMTNPLDGCVDVDA